jgi:nicotinate-nucleotide--dimethylbenzimidazole phosphoribosyltransferase
MSNLADRVEARLNSLTKPVGSLGRLEDIVRRYCSITSEFLPPPLRKGLFIFCADHGITAEGVSPFPSEVTRQMTANFRAGGAAVNVLCRRFEVEPAVIDMGVGKGTRNFAREPAMTRQEADAAVRRGRYLARTAAASFDLLAAGEMGIGNTTSAAAIVSAITGRDPSETAGAGTGLDASGVARKAGVIRRALAMHQPNGRDPLAVLSAVGGFEIAAMAGFYLGCFTERCPFVVDGFIASAALLAARLFDPAVIDCAFFGHQSAERGHSLVLAELDARPILDLGLRLGEGTGAVMAMNVIETALQLYREMATFEEAAVSGIR